MRLFVCNHCGTQSPDPMKQFSMPGDPAFIGEAHLCPACIAELDALGDEFTARTREFLGAKDVEARP